MSGSPSSLPATLMMIQENLTFYVLPSYLLFGLFGNTICVIYFLQKSQRTSSCALYLLLAAITNTLAVSFGVTTTVLNSWKSFATASLVYCKLRMFINHSLIFIGRTYTVLASIDTYTMSSPNRHFRGFSQRSMAIKSSIVVVFLCPLIAVHIPIMNTIVANQCVMTGVYTLVFAIYQMCIAGILPPLFMIIFSCLAYRNLRNFTFDADERRHRKKKRQQRQLIRMVTTQLIVYIISAELVPITTLYRQLTSTMVKSADRKSVESFIIFIAMNFLLYMNTWAAFFIYCATSSNFRFAFVRLFKRNVRTAPLNTLALDRSATAATHRHTHIP